MNKEHPSYGPCLFPEVDTFHNLFYKCGKKKWDFRQQYLHGSSQKIGNYINIDIMGDENFHSGYCQIRDKFMPKMSEHTISIQYDEGHFKIVGFPKDGTAYVYWQYNSIIGTRFIAVIKLNSIPKKLLKG